MSQCKGSCSCPKKQCNCARNFKASKGINFKTPAENKETITDDTKPKTTSVACAARKPTTSFWDDVNRFVELGNKIVNYAKEQQMKSGASSEDEATSDTTYDSDFESGEDSGGSRKQRCDLGCLYPPMSYNASSNLSRTPIPQGASTPKTFRGGLPNVNCGVACCQCPTNISSLGIFGASSAPNHPTFGGTYAAGARSPRARLTQRSPELSLDVSVPSGYRQTRTGGAGGGTFNMGTTRSGGAAGTTFNRGQRSRDAAGATRSGGALRTFDMGHSRNGTFGLSCPNGAGGEIFDMDGSPPGFSGLATGGTDAWGSFGGDGSPPGFSGLATGGTDAWGSFGGGARSLSPGPFSRAANVEVDDSEEWVAAEDIINEATAPHCPYQDMSFDFADNALQEPEEWLDYESSMPAPAPPYRPHCMGGIHDEHDEMCGFAAQTSPRSHTGQTDSTMSTFCRSPMFRSPETHTSSPAGVSRGYCSPYFESPAARSSGRN